MDNTFNELIEQDLFKAIIAIAILVVIFIIVIIFRVISSTKKKQEVMKKRKKHMAEMERSVAKRVEQTQTISRQELQSMANKKEKPIMPERREQSSLEKTQEINLDAIRKKQMLEVKKQNTMELNRSEIMQELDTRSGDANYNAIRKKQMLEEKMQNTMELKLDDIKTQLDNTLEQTLDLDKASLMPEKAAYDNDYRVSPVVTPHVATRVEPIKEFGSLEQAQTELQKEQKKFEDFTEYSAKPSLQPVSQIDETPFDDIVTGPAVDETLDSTPSVETSTLLAGELPLFTPTEEELEYNVLNEEDENNFSIVQSFDTIITEESIVEPDYEIEEFTTLELKDQLRNYDDEVMSTEFDMIEEYIEDESTFESALARIVDQDFADFAFEVDNTRVGDYDYVNTFDFGFVYFEDVLDLPDSINRYNFGINNHQEDFEAENAFGEAAFDFGINQATADSTFEEEIERTFDFGYQFDDASYELVGEDMPETFIFNKAYYYVDLNDLIDVALSNTVTSTKDEKFLEEVTEAPGMEFAQVVHHDTNKPLEKEVAKAIADDRVFENDVVAKEAEVMTLKNDNVVIDVTSQLDLLDTYDDPEIDDFDFADENYNYNFNNINIMDEVVNDVLFDESPVAQDDEYLQYVYQFALLEDAIDAQSVEVVEDFNVDKPIVNKVSLHIDKFLTDAPQQKEANKNYQYLSELFNETEVKETVVTRADNKIDHELMTLSNMVLSGDATSERDEVAQKKPSKAKKKDDKAYTKAYSTKAFSPIFGLNTGKKKSENELEDTILPEIEEELVNKLSLGKNKSDASLTDYLDEIEELENDDLEMSVNLVDYLEEVVTDEDEKEDIDSFMDNMLEKSVRATDIEEEEDFLSTLKEMSK